ncbi:General transcription factor II-I repeat domain-containing protein 2A [Thelohanellus kitauei]|uniref:General transcription factor II-I repeat domain-containing protein 2A n=1 Tax=Thelohanellus kitauei TaxID=669202 RepID=A0A0C2N1N4_THEKT|nr:General transcription factor II-I repeat domain-containing protein 2A [Thelohanellus kitauei]
MELLIELQADLVIKSKFNNIDLIDFYRFCLAEEKCKKLHIFSRNMISLFGSTYVCEQFFSRIKYIKSKNRIRLTDGNLENSLLVSISNIDADIVSFFKNLINLFNKSLMFIFIYF